MTQVSNGASPEQLEREIAETRAEIDATLVAIQNKLSPGQLLDQALGYVRRNGGEFAGNVGRSMRDNPLPLALVGVGLSWLMVAGNRPDSRPAIDRAGPTDGDGRTREYVSGTARAVGDWATSTREDIKRKADEVVSEGQERVHRAGETVKETYEEAQAGAASLARSAAAGAGRAQEFAGRFINDHPLVIGAVAVAAGAVLGAFVPMTRREGEIMGEEAAQARKAVSDGAEETFGTAKKVARAVRTGAKKRAAEGTGMSKNADRADRGGEGPAAVESDSR